MINLLSAAALLLFTLPAAISQSECCTPNPPCLGASEAASFGLRWLTIFFTDTNGIGTGAPLVIPTIAENFTYYDEGLSVTGPAYHNRSELLSVVGGPGYNGLLTTNITYSVLFTFASCDTIGLRWLSNQNAANGTDV